MGNGSDLLKMLEPAIRPVQQLGASGVQKSDLPFEQKDFDALLSEAESIVADRGLVATPRKKDAAKDQQHILSDLTRFDSIENASLRDVLNGSFEESIKNKAG